MKPIRIVALDVDGTLITDDFRITELTKQAIRQVHEQGARIVLCTGRSPDSTLPLLEELGLEGAVITHNGAVTVDSRGKAVLNDYSFPIAEVEPFITYCRAEGIHFDVNSAFDLYVDHLPEEFRESYANYLAVPVEAGDVLKLEVPIVKVSVCAETPILERIMKRWPSIGDSGLRIIMSGEYFIDIMHPGANKGNALGAYAQQLGVAVDEVLAIGNYYNDIEMIEYAGIGVAMDNSPEDVKKKADWVTASNNEEGVYHALRKYAIIGNQ